VLQVKGRIGIGIQIMREKLTSTAKAGHMVKDMKEAYLTCARKDLVCSSMALSMVMAQGGIDAS
jgi:hypothetical protein